jgi:hypothetical protein
VDSFPYSLVRMLVTNHGSRIVEYATREQAQKAVAQLSNQNLMGRLVYVREVRYPRGMFGRVSMLTPK